MNTDVTKAGAFDAADEKMVRYLGLDPSRPADQAVVAVAQHYGLDPLLKHVIVIPKGGVYITRDGLLHVAHRSGQLDGIVVEQDPTLVEDEWIARVSVYRKDMGHPFTFPGRYPVGRGNREFAQEMALKAAESHALRRAFDINGLPALDERRPEQAPARQSAADLVGPATSSYDDTPGATADGEQAEPITAAQQKRLGALMREAGITERTDALAYVSQTLGGLQVASRSDLTKAQASTVIDALTADVEAIKEGRATDLVTAAEEQGDRR